MDDPLTQSDYRLLPCILIHRPHHLVGLLRPPGPERFQPLLREKLQAADPPHVTPMRSVGRSRDVPEIVGEQPQEHIARSTRPFFVFTPQERIGGFGRRGHNPWATTHAKKHDGAILCSQMAQCLVQRHPLPSQLVHVAYNRQWLWAGGEVQGIPTPCACCKLPHQHEAAECEDCQDVEKTPRRPLHFGRERNRYHCDPACRSVTIARVFH